MASVSSRMPARDPFKKPKRNPFRPCPFCGNREIRLLPQPNGWMSADCIRCGAMKRQVTNYKRQMYAEWNNRRPPEAINPYRPDEIPFKDPP